MKSKIKNTFLMAFHWAMYTFWVWMGGKEAKKAVRTKRNGKLAHTGSADKGENQYDAYVTLAKRKGGNNGTPKQA